jgi:hypothetical protein
MIVPKVVARLLTASLLVLPLAGPALGQGLEPGDSCEVLDNFCDERHPCAPGEECRLDLTDCGANFGGTFPACFVTHACLPKCFPGGRDGGGLRGRWR